MFELFQMSQDVGNPSVSLPYVFFPPGPMLCVDSNTELEY